MIRSHTLIPRVRDERGFTLVELLVAMSVGLVILFATLTAFEAFNRGTESNSRLTDAEDRSRRDVSNIVRILRDAGAPAPISGTGPRTFERVLANDIIFRSTSWPGESAVGITGTHIERLCLDTASHTVYFEGRRSGVTGPSDPGEPCPSTGVAGWTSSPLAQSVTNTAELPLFRLPSGTVRSIGVQLRSERGTTVQSRTLPLSSGASPRGVLAPQLGPGDVAVTCNADGSGKPLLTLTGTTPNLNVQATGGLTLGPGKVLLNLTGSFTQTVTLTITNALGLQTLLIKEVSCP